MIDKATAVAQLMRKLAKLPEGHCIDLRTYKRNRGLVIGRAGKDSFQVAEFGYVEECFTSDLKGMRKLLKTLFKREFPRSTKLRLYDMGPCQPFTDRKSVV